MSKYLLNFILIIFFIIICPFTVDAQATDSLYVDSSTTINDSMGLDIKGPITLCCVLGGTGMLCSIIGGLWLDGTIDIYKHQKEHPDDIWELNAFLSASMLGIAISNFSFILVELGVIHKRVKEYNRINSALFLSKQGAGIVLSIPLYRSQ